MPKSQAGQYIHRIRTERDEASELVRELTRAVGQMSLNMLRDGRLTDVVKAHDRATAWLHDHKSNGKG